MNIVPVENILATVQSPVFTESDYEFLVQQKEWLSTVQEQTFQWRTNYQKLSILNDQYHPTLHGKFHQAMLECNVQFEQALYLAKEFEEKKLDIEEMVQQLDDCAPDSIAAKRLRLKISFAQFELAKMKTLMQYRMKEVRGWKQIMVSLENELRQSGMQEQDIWEKEAGEEINWFLLHLTKLHGIKNSTDGAESHHLLSLARFAVQRAQQLGTLESWISIYCQPVHLEALQYLGVIDERRQIIREAGQDNGVGHIDPARAKHSQPEVEHD